MINKCKECGEETEAHICSTCKTSKYMIKISKGDDDGKTSKFVL